MFKFFHISDLHLGKYLHRFPLIDDQRYILNQILHEADNENPDGVLIAGDVFDKDVPSEDAIALFDDFLFQLAEKETEVFVIAGNHDSDRRLACNNRLLRNNVHIAPAYDGNIKPIRYKDAAVWLLPFVKPSDVRSVCSITEKETIKDYTDALRWIIGKMTITDGINILVAHQFVTTSHTSPATCDSESRNVGGVDNVDANVFEPFDYVALGHIHGKQHAGRKNIRYCGSPLKYSISESKHTKSLTVIDLQGKDVSIREIALLPKRDLREIRGTYKELTENTHTDDYLHITLTDDNELPNVKARLEMVYPHILQLDYDNTRTRQDAALMFHDNIRERVNSPLELFSDFYQQQNGSGLNDRQRNIVEKLLEEIPS